MKLLRNTAVYIIAFFVFSTSSWASLIDVGNGLIYDDAQNLTWMQDANYGGTMTWNEANNWAANLIFGGYDDWRLPSSDTCAGSGCTSSEMGYLYYNEGITSSTPGLFTGINPYMYWSSTEYSSNPAQAYRFSFKYGTQGVSDKTLTRYAWAVRDGSPVPAAPEPSSAFLFISGAAAFAGIRKRAARRRIKLTN
ncbi:MAG: DUF1566 domain-containing protein [Nitrospirae bacterium]|nr:DUF1566 domain-containing protein [Nitrospirota bacterium]